jgi:chromosome segregation ATPase
MGSNASPLRRIARPSASIGVTRLPDFTTEQVQHAPPERLQVVQLGRMEALQRAISDAREERDRSKTGLDQGAFQAIERVREIADHLRASDQRVGDLEAGLQAMKERAQRELKSAAQEVEQANARTAAEMARADAAERRAEEAEDRLSEIMIVIQEELASGRSGRG